VRRLAAVWATLLEGGVHVALLSSFLVLAVNP
jgi:hypothetical protein